MKKVAATLTVLLLAAGFSTAYACEHYKSYTMARATTEAPKGQFVLEMEGKRLEKRNVSPGETVYTVKSTVGEVLAQDINDVELSQRYPEIYSRMNG
jgi:hypothetical protein